jgi:integrase
MTKIKLTQAIVDKATPVTTTSIYWDEHISGFGLKITTKGHKSFLIQTRVDGREYKRTLYRADLIKLEKARNEAKILLGRIASGENPFESVSTDIKTLTAFSEIYIQEHALKHKKPRSATDDQALLRNHILPWLGTLHPEKITRRQVTLFKDAVADGRTAKKARAKGICKDNRLKGGPICANRCLALLSKVFSFGIAESYLERADNPVYGIKKYKENVREEYLNLDQLNKLSRAIRRARRNRVCNIKAVYIIELIMLTGARKSEISGLLWEEVDLDSGLLRKIDTKTGARNIPLSDRAQRILHIFKKKRAPADTLVFPNAVGTPVCIRGAWKRIRELAKLPTSFTPHTLRHTLASHAAMNGKTGFQIANILGHKSMDTTKRYVKMAHDSGIEDVNDVVNGMFE